MKNKFPTPIFKVMIAASCAIIAQSATNVLPVCSADTNSSTKAAPAAKEKGKEMSKIYDFTEKSLTGKEINLGTYKGDVLLIVNTASKCGFTPQYAGLEDLNKKYSPKGLKVLGFPCNQFGAQEPGTSEEIHSFCQRNYGVDFQMFEKIDVNGAKADPLYVYLKEHAPNDKGLDIRWNFSKFLVDRQGNIVKRYDSKVKPEDLQADIEKLL